MTRTTQKVLLSIILPVGFSFAQSPQQKPGPFLPRDQMPIIEEAPPGDALRLRWPQDLKPSAKSSALLRPITFGNRNAVLSTASQEAVSLAQSWQNGDSMPTVSADGVVRFRYGAALPTIACAPLHIVSILLQPGEHIQKKPLLGDEQRFGYNLVTAGSGPDAREVVAVYVLKSSPGIQTDLVIATDRRIYQLSLVSKPDQHLSQVEFSYPDEQNAEWQNFQKDRAQREEQAKAAISLHGDPNYGYRLEVAKHKPAPPFLPYTVFDDSRQTFLKMPASAQNWDAAVLQVAGPNGCEVVNYRVQGNTWIVDRLFERAELVSGTGKDAQRVFIQREGVSSVSHCDKTKTEPVAEMAKR